MSRSRCTTQVLQDRARSLAKLYLVSACLATLVISAAASAISEPDAPPLLQKIPLDGYAHRKLLEDAPVSDMVWHKGELFLAGKSSLWRYQPANSRLSRIQLMTAHENPNNDQLQKIAVFHDEFYVGSARALFQIRWEPKSIFRYQLPESLQTGELRTLGLSYDGLSLWWIHEQGIFAADLARKTLQHIFPEVKLLQGNDIWLNAAQKDLWILGNKGLSVFNLEKSVQPKLLYPSDAKLLRLHIDVDEVFALSRHSIIRFDSRGGLQQLIPVSGPAQLVAMSLIARNHGYFFSNGSLEIYDLTKKSKTVFRTHLENPAGVSQLALGDEHVAVLENHIPHIFKKTPSS